MRAVHRVHLVRWAVLIITAQMCAPIGPALAQPEPAGQAFQLDRSMRESPVDDRIISLDRVRVRVGNSATHQAAVGVERELPDHWTRAQLGEHNEARVRAEFELPTQPDELWGVYLPRLRMNAGVAINGVQVGDGGRFGDNPARNWNRPLYFEIPSSILSAGTNIVDIRMATTSLSDLRLVAVSVGPDSALRPLFEERRFRQVTLRGVMVALSLATALLVGFVAFRRPEIRAAPWFAAVFGCIAFAHSDGVVRDLPVPAALWQWANASAFVLIAGFTVNGLNRGLGFVRPRLERGVWLTIAMLVVFIAIAPYAFVTVSVGLLGIGLVLLAYSVASIVASMRRTRPRAGPILLSGAVALSAIVFHDLQSGYSGWALPWSPLTQFVPLVMALCAAWLLLSYVLDALSASEALASELDDRVDAIRSELNENYESLREMRRQQAAADERERIMRDMHDGIGGQLVSALAMVRRGTQGSSDAADVLQEALDEMRMLLDSASVTEDLASVLGSLRARTQARLSGHGLELDWRIGELPDLPGLGPSGAVQIVRIVQESLNNVIKHARATRVTIAAALRANADGEDMIHLEIADDGRGMNRDAAGSDRGGLSNIRWRAARLGGTVEFESDNDGTRVRVWLPTSVRADQDSDDSAEGDSGIQRQPSCPAGNSKAIPD